MFNFRPNLPWLRLRPEIPDDNPPGFRLTPENPLGFSPPSRGAGDLPDILTGIAQGTTAAPSSGDISWPYASLVHFPQLSERQWQPAQPSLNVGGQFSPGEAAPGFFDELPSSPLGIDFLTGVASRPAASSSGDIPWPYAGSFPQISAWRWQPTQSSQGADGQRGSAAPGVSGAPLNGPLDVQIGAAGVTPGDPTYGDAGPGYRAYDPIAPSAPPLGATSWEVALPAPQERYPADHSIHDPPDLPASTSGGVQEALDEIARIYGTRDVWTDGEANAGAGFGVGDVFDPQYVLPTQAPPGSGRPPPFTPPKAVPPPPIGKPSPGVTSPTPRREGDNKGPPLDKPPPSSVPPSIPPPSSGQGGAQLPRPLGGTNPPPDQAGPAAAAQGQSQESPQTHPSPRIEGAWEQLAKVATGEAPDPQYDKSSGQATGVGVFVDRRLPAPAAGWEYDPPFGHLRSGYVGELRLANRILSALRGEIVVHYGMAAGMRGPDVISVAPDGTISVWDSKWRTGSRLIRSGAHQSRSSLDLARKEVQKQIELAVKSGRLTGEAAVKATDNADKGNFLVITVGTGNAHGGVVRSVLNGDYADSRGK